MKFLKNTWYPAMWAKDLEPGSMVGRTIINEPVLFARKPDGSLAAMSDVCPHRYVPLSLGRMLENGRVQCVYHGLEFDSSGHCVRNPHGEGKIPTGLCARTYAVQEKHTIIWIWMGEQTPDLTTIPDFSLMDDADDGMSRGRDSMVIEANYLLIADNLLDLSHANFLHDGILGLPEHSSAKITVDQTGNTVRTGRWMPDVPVARLHDLLFKRDGKKGRYVERYSLGRARLPHSYPWFRNAGLRSCGRVRISGRASADSGNRVPHALRVWHCANANGGRTGGAGRGRGDSSVRFRTAGQGRPGGSTASTRKPLLFRRKTGAALGRRGVGQNATDSGQVDRR